MRSRLPAVSLRWPPAWTDLVHDEIQYRIAHGTGNARLQFVLRDALLAATPTIPQIAHPSKDEDGVQQQTISVGPTLAAHLDEAAAAGWKAAAYARAALHYYLHAFDVFSRPRNLPGCDPLADPADPTLDWRTREELGHDPS